MFSSVGCDVSVFAYFGGWVTASSDRNHSLNDCAVLFMTLAGEMRSREMYNKHMHWRMKCAHVLWFSWNLLLYRLLRRKSCAFDRQMTAASAVVGPFGFSVHLGAVHIAQRLSVGSHEHGARWWERQHRGLSLTSSTHHRVIRLCTFDTFSWLVWRLLVHCIPVFVHHRTNRCSETQFCRQVYQWRQGDLFSGGTI